MTEKTNQNRSVEKTVRDIRRATGRNYSVEEKTGSCWKIYEAKTVLQSHAVRKASMPMSITAGQKNFWKSGRNG
ncbi:hypothetical protein SAMN05428978_101183 [Nitrosomonas sp. Nm34]|nr:hypothetical protein SAMN05428978_101183 [Nitrosomonas sp. Nm34]